MSCPEDETFNVASHLAGLVLASAGGLPLVTVAIHRGHSIGALGAAIFSLSAAFLFGASTMYHGAGGGGRSFWMRVDHSAIFVMIAGSFTAFALAAPLFSWSAAVLATIWILALLAFRREWKRAPDAKPHLKLYLGMGWAGVSAAVPLVITLGRSTLAWLLAGAAAYTVGTVFYLNGRTWRHAHGVWHCFVVAGAGCHFVALACALA